MKINYPQTNHRFYQNAHPAIHFFCHIFIKGDLLLLPLLIIIFSSAFFSIKFALIFYGVYLAVRYSAEIFYWLLQQFGSHQYRPHDFGLKNLNNNAIYIIYQLIATIWVVLAIMLIISSLLYL